MLEVHDKPEAVGFDSGRLRRIRSFFQERYVDTGRLPGVQIVVSRRGQVVVREEIGWRTVESRDALGPDTIFRIYSMTKPITSVALMMLYEEGRFQLDDPVSRFVPAWAGLRVFDEGTHLKFSTRFPEREMQIRDLLTHTSGLTYGFMARHPVDALYRARGVERVGGLSNAAGTAETIAEMVDRLSEIPLLFSPGTRWSYSVATDVCGHLVELISGRRFDEFLHERILGPLAMSDTAFHVPADKVERFSTTYSPIGSNPLVPIDPIATSSYLQPPSFLSGGGGLVSTAHDYHRFTQMLLQGGTLDGARILGRKTVQYMAANHLPTGGDLTSMGTPVFSETPYDGIGFGLGFSVVLDPARAGVVCSAGEYAWGGAASTTFWVDPAEEITAMLFTQLIPSSTYPIRRELRTLVYQALVD